MPLLERSNLYKYVASRPCAKIAVELTHTPTHFF
jgi:hypothetical protein